MWHLEACDLAIDGASFRGDFGGGIGLYACASDTALKTVDMKGQYKPYFQGWMPIWKGGPHEHRPIPTPVMQGAFTGGHRVVTVLYPYKDGRCPVKAVNASADPAANECTLVLVDGTERVLSL